MCVSESELRVYIYIYGLGMDIGMDNIHTLPD